MIKKILIPKNVEEIKNLSSYFNGVLLPLEDLSVNYTNCFKINQIDQVKEYCEEIFVLINKNFHHNELDNLKNTLKILDKKNINGIFFYDLAIINFQKEIKIPLVWDQEHLTTNYLTVNYWYDKGVFGTHLSNEITKKEINDIKKNTKAKLFLTVFGYIPIFTSKRHLIKNYLKTFHLDERKNYYIEKENKKYRIVDYDHGSFVYTDYILDIRSELDELDIDYAIYSSVDINEEIFEKVIKEDARLENTNNGFIDKETIYKVKK